MKNTYYIPSRESVEVSEERNVARDVLAGVALIVLTFALFVGGSMFLAARADAAPVVRAVGTPGCVDTAEFNGSNGAGSTRDWGRRTTEDRWGVLGMGVESGDFILYPKCGKDPSKVMYGVSYDGDFNLYLKVHPVAGTRAFLAPQQPTARVYPQQQPTHSVGYRRVVDAGFPGDGPATRLLVQFNDGSVYLFTHCRVEDDYNCYWLGFLDGNGVGRSFVNFGGKVIFIPNRLLDRP